MSAMKCAIVSDFGDPGTVLTFDSGHARPVPRRGEMLVRVHACSLAAGDVLMIKGAVRAIVKPRSFPYIPGMDICGVVEEAPASAPFKKGDHIIASRGTTPTGGLAEFAAVNMKEAALAPKSVSPVQAAALPVSAVTAMQAADAARLKDGERVLILGGSGGVGSSLVQLARNHVGSDGFIAATSTAADMVRSLGADTVVDYRSQNWWELSEFKDKPFDVLFDCVGQSNSWPAAMQSGTMKTRTKGGRFVAVSFMDDPQLHTTWQALSAVGPVMTRSLWTRLWSRAPRFSLLISTSCPKELAKVVKLVDDGKLKVVQDASSPLPFTEAGVKCAFEVMCSGHAKGKVVVDMSQQDSPAHMHPA